MDRYLSDEELRRIQRLIATPQPSEKPAETGRPIYQWMGPYRLHQRLSPRSWLATTDEDASLSVVRILGSNLPKRRLDQIARRLERLARLSHPVLSIQGKLQSCETCHYLVREYVPGRNLAQVEVPPGTALYVAYQIANALQFAHERRQAHGRLTPQNILLDSVGNPYVVDFQIRRLEEQGLITDSVEPELDVTDMGTLFLSLITGLPLGEVLMTDPLRMLKPVSPPVDPLLLNIATRVLGKDSFPSAGALADALGEACRYAYADPEPDTGLLEKFQRHAAKKAVK
ncbi:MAG: protein kinase [Planctomycetes bacterium]|nr:protein kinase [Planctomycetota bacterium]